MPCNEVGHRVDTNGHTVEEIADMVLTGATPSSDRPAHGAPFYESTATWDGSGWDVTLSHGTVYVSGVNQPLQAIRDRHVQGGQMK